MRLRSADDQELLDAFDRALQLADEMALYGITAELMAGRAVLIGTSEPNHVADAGSPSGAEQGLDDWWADRHDRIEIAARTLEEAWAALDDTGFCGRQDECASRAHQ